MLVLRRVRVGSAFKVGFVVNGLLAIVFGLVAFLLQVGLLNFITSAASFDVYSPGQSASAIEALRAVSLVGTCFFYAIAVIFGAVFGGIGFALMAFFYNLTARWVGGLELETMTTGTGLLDEIEAEIYGVEKQKRY